MNHIIARTCSILPSSTIINDMIDDEHIISIFKIVLYKCVFENNIYP